MSKIDRITVGSEVACQVLNHLLDREFIFLMGKGNIEAWTRGVSDSLCDENIAVDWNGKEFVPA